MSYSHYAKALLKTICGSKDERTWLLAKDGEPDRRVKVWPMSDCPGLWFQLLLCRVSSLFDEFNKALLSSASV